MGIIRFAKVIASLPVTLVRDTFYAVRTGTGFDLYLSDATGSVAHPLNVSGGVGAPVETGPAFTYSGGRLTLITYDSGNTKTFTYDGSGRLSRIDYVVGATTNRKDFVYNPDGSLASIDETVI